MNIKRILSGALAAAILVLGACSDDESAPKEHFSFGEEAIELKNAKLYLTVEGEAGNGTHLYRDYFITDGTYTNGGNDEGWSINDYTNATYFLGVELAVPLGEEIGSGEFPQHSNWSGVTTNISYIYFETGHDEETYVEYYTDNDTEDHSPVSVTGGVDDGDTMTLKFSGKLTYYSFDGINWSQETVSGKFYFKGKVNDERETAGPARVEQKSHVKRPSL